MIHLSGKVEGVDGFFVSPEASGKGGVLGGGNSSDVAVGFVHNSFFFKFDYSLKYELKCNIEC